MSLLGLAIAGVCSIAVGVFVAFVVAYAAAARGAWRGKGV